MKNITRKSFLSGAAILGMAGLAACGGNSSDSSASTSDASGSDRKGNVYWLNFKPELDETAQALAKDYTKKYPNVKVKVVTAASGTYEQTLTSEMDKDEAPTLFVIGNTASVKEWGDYAMDLKDTDIYNALNTHEYDLTDKDGKVVSIGYCYECYGIVVNSDLLTKAGYDVKDITNFDALKKASEDIHSRAADLGFDAWADADMDDANSWRVTGHLANLEYYYEEKDDGGWSECPKSIKGTYLPNYKNIFDLMTKNSPDSADTLATGGHDPATQFNDGKVVFYLTGSWDYATINEKQSNTTMIPYYCGVDGEEKAGLNCGTENCWAINDNASDEDKKATMDFMLWLVTDSDASAKMVEQLGILPYTDAAPSNNGYLKAASDYEANGNYVMDWATNYQPNVDDYRAALVSAINKYDNGGQSDDIWNSDVKSAFVDGWAEQYKKANQE